MSKEALFLYGMSAVAFLFAAINMIWILAMRKKTAVTTATVVSVKTISPESMKRLNSKWAQVSYKVGKKNYTPVCRIQVPMTAQIGSRVSVRYDKNQPEKLYAFSGKRMAAGLLTGIFCIILAHVV